MFDTSELLSDSKYECFDFHDLKQLDESHKQQVIQAATQLLHSLLKKIHYKHHQVPFNQQLRSELWQWATDHILPLVGVEKWNKLQLGLETAANTGEAFYQKCENEVQLKMAQLTALHVCIDDENLINGAERLKLSTVSARILQGLPQTTSWGRLLADNISDYVSYFGARDSLVGTIGANGYSAFLDANTLEQRLLARLPVHLAYQERSKGMSESPIPLKLSAAQGFPYYLRKLTAASSVYFVPIFKVSSRVEVPLEYWVSTIPSLECYIGLANDFLSFPKEVKAGETENYVALSTKVHRLGGHSSKFTSGLWTYRDTLQELIDDILRATQALDQAFVKYASFETSKLTEDENTHLKLAGDLWEGFKYGYISWHLNCERYQLDDLANTLTLNDFV